MKLMIMAGGTGGHVYPALAVAQDLRSRGHEVVWMGAPESFESRVVPKQGFAMEFVRISGLRGKGWLAWLAAPWLLLRALVDALGALRRQRPAAVLGMGGFAAGPGGVAAWLRHRPLVIHEQNAAAGLTNRLLARLARRTLQAFPGTFARAEDVGNPVRAVIASLAPPEQRLAEHAGMTHLLVLGGSQGARALNEVVPAAIALMPDSARPAIWHQAGRTLEAAQEAYARSRVICSVEAFIEDMASAYAWADLVVCRAGASTIAELAAAGCASVLVPFPFAVDDHQTKNAQFLVEGGAAVLIPESALTAEALAGVLAGLLGDRSKLVAMARAARDKAWRGAEKRIADTVLAEARE